MLQFLITAEVLQIGVIFFCSERMVLDLKSRETVREQYRVCSFTLVYVLSLVCTSGPVLLGLFNAQPFNSFGAVSDGAFCWLTCTLLQYFFAYSVAVPTLVYCVVVTIRLSIAVNRHVKRGTLQRSSHVLVYLYKRVGFFVMVSKC